MDRLPTNLPIIEQSKPRSEVLCGPERRRRWSSEEKARVVAESLAPNAVASAVARRHGIHPNQLYGWRRDLRLAAMPLPDFVPVSLTAESRIPRPAVEIAFGGAVVRAAPGVDLAFLSDVLRVVRALG
jgi:transposase